MSDASELGGMCSRHGSLECWPEGLVAREVAVWRTKCDALAAELVQQRARVEELEAERDDLWNKLGEAMAGWNTAEARIARADEALEMCRAPRYDTAEARRILRGEDTPETN